MSLTEIISPVDILWYFCEHDRRVDNVVGCYFPLRRVKHWRGMPRRRKKSYWRRDLLRSKKKNAFIAENFTEHKNTYGQRQQRIANNRTSKTVLQFSRKSRAPRRKPFRIQIRRNVIILFFAETVVFDW